jgi:CRISPR system Cascade subunit CasC
VQRAIEEIFSGRKAVDLALFGRMVADAPERNVEAACQVAHAISTHRVNADLDFFTALDDLQPQGEPGAGMMGTVEFNSACMYRYALLDLVQLKNNLEGDAELALEAALAFLKASVQAVPSGKQNSMAAHNPPSLVMVVIRTAGVPWSLANAFQHPVTAGTPDQGGLVEQSIRRLDAYWGRLQAVYGTTGIQTSVALTVEDVPLSHVGRRAANLKELLNAVRTAVEENPQWRSC